MSYLRTCCLAALALLYGIGASLAQDDKAKGKTEPAGAPVKAVLVAKKDTYTLDLGNMTAEQRRKEIKDAEKLGFQPPAVPAVELILELHNTGTKDLQIWVEGDPPQLTLDLQGPGAVSIKPNVAFAGIFIAPKAVKLAPGKSHSIAISKLQYGFRNLAQYAYWTEPGVYTLTASFKTGLLPTPKDAKVVMDGFGEVTITSAPLKLKVEGKK